MTIAHIQAAHRRRVDARLSSRVNTELRRLGEPLINPSKTTLRRAKKKEAETQPDALIVKLAGLIDFLPLSLAYIQSRWKTFVKNGDLPPPWKTNPPRWKRGALEAFFADTTDTPTAKPAFKGTPRRTPKPATDSTDLMLSLMKD